MQHDNVTPIGKQDVLLSCSHEPRTVTNRSKGDEDVVDDERAAAGHFG